MKALTSLWAHERAHQSQVLHTCSSAPAAQGQEVLAHLARWSPVWVLEVNFWSWPLIASASLKQARQQRLSPDPSHPASAAALFHPVPVPCWAAGSSVFTFASKNRFYPVFARVSRFTVNRSRLVLSSGEGVAWKSMRSARKGCLVGRVVLIKSIFK